MRFSVFRIQLLKKLFFWELTVPKPREKKPERKKILFDWGLTTTMRMPLAESEKGGGQ
jgi:hypothetical protein